MWRGRRSFRGSATTPGTSTPCRSVAASSDRPGARPLAVAARAPDRVPARAARREASRATEARTEASWAEATCQLSGLLVPLAFHTLGTVSFESTKVLLLRL